MENNNSGSSFLDSAKDFAVGAYDKTKEELSRVQKNSVERQHIVDRETKANLLTSRQQEQLKKISNADDAQRFVEAAQLGGASGGQKEYQQIIDNQRKALISFGTDVAGLAVGGAAVKGGLKLGGSIFKGGAEAIGSKLPSLKKYSNVFKSETELADEAKAAATAQKEAEAQKKAQEYVQQQRQQAGKQSTPFKSNTEKLVEKAKEEVKDETTPNKKGYIRRTLEWMGDKAGGAAAGAGKFVGRQVLSEGKTLGKSVLKGGMYGAAATGIGAGIYNTLSEEDQLAAKNKAQELVDAGTEKFPGLVDEAGNILKGAIEGTTEESVWDKIKNKGKELLGEYGEKIPGAALGAYVGSSSSSPFRGVVGGMGALMPAGNSAEATLSSMPSGGDSGTTGESHFGSGDMSGKTAVEVLNSIYSILSKTYDTVVGISKDVSAMVKGQSQQDIARDLSSENLRARQNEGGGGGGSASPIFGGGERESVDLNKEESEKSSGIWSKVLSKIPVGKVLKGAAVGGAAAAGLAYSGAASGSEKTAEPIKGNKSKNPHKDYQEHYDKVYNLALKEAKQRGLENPEAQAHLAASQSIEETGGGHHVPKNNLFGIKYSGKGQGTTDPTGELSSPEERNGKMSKEKSRFRGYKSEEDSVKDRFDFLEKNKIKRYDKALKAQTPEQAIAEMGSSGYATSSRYGKALADHYATYGKKVGDAPSDEIQTASKSKTSTPITKIEKPNNTGFINASYNPDESNNFSLNTETNSQENPVSYSDVPDSEKLNVTNTTGPDNNKSQVDLLNDAVDKMNSTKYEFFDEDTDSIHERQDKLSADRAKTNEEKLSTNKASPVPNSKMDDMQAEVGDIDAQKASLKSERENISMAVNVSGEQFNKDEDRIKDISTEMGALNERRNNITGSKEYLEGIENMKQGGGNTQTAPQQAQQQAAAPPRNNPGVAKSVPPVRNDDPTIKMMEEGNMWRTNTHEA
jgi:flagellum-specific peptidoglycan hydrolase FlgJ